MSEGKAATSIVVHDDLDVAEQDYADGAALRRLREAAVALYPESRVSVGTLNDRLHVAVTHYLRWEPDEFIEESSGDTIAEAAILGHGLRWLFEYGGDGFVAMFHLDIPPHICIAWDESLGNNTDEWAKDATDQRPDLQAVRAAILAVGVEA